MFQKCRYRVITKVTRCNSETKKKSWIVQVLPWSIRVWGLGRKKLMVPGTGLNTTSSN